MLVIPAVDIKGGKCVRLYQGRGDQETVYSEDPGGVASAWESQGARFLHVVDLDGAFQGEPVNRDAIFQILKSVSIPVEVGGGIRSLEAVEETLKLGIKRVVIGSRAAVNTDFLRDLHREFKERIVPSIDASQGWVMIEGWKKKTSLKAVALGREIKKIGFKLAIHTDTGVDGTLLGPNLAAHENFLDETGLAVIAAGGISGLSDILKLKLLESRGLIGVIVGKALYEGKLDLKAAIAAV